MKRAIVMRGSDEPFDGFKNGQGVTLAIRGFPEQPIPVFADDRAIQKWQGDMAAAYQRGEDEKAHVFPEEAPGFLFYASQATRGVITKLKRVEITSRSWVDCANVRLNDGTNREGLVPLGMIFNPKREKRIEKEMKRLRDENQIP
jgi:hypothetical protein